MPSILKPPLGLSCEQEIEWHAADKRRRYHIEKDEGQSIFDGGRFYRLAVKFTPCSLAESKRVDDPHWIILYNVDSLSPTSRYEGPPWKRGHQAYYVRAALLEMVEQGVLPPLHPASRPVEGLPRPHISVASQRPPLPPVGPKCPKCAAICGYAVAHVGGRGTCWRHVCPNSVLGPGADNEGNCDYIERWKS